MRPPRGIDDNAHWSASVHQPGTSRVCRAVGGTGRGWLDDGGRTGAWTCTSASSSTHPGSTRPRCMTMPTDHDARDLQLFGPQVCADLDRFAETAPPLTDTQKALLVPLFRPSSADAPEVSA